LTDWWLTLASVEAILKTPDKNIETICALSPMQEGLLFHALLTPGSAVYFEQVCCRLGKLESIAKFRHAWQMAVDRHAALRTGFYWKNRKRPLQIVRRECTLPWIEEDWRGIGADEQRTRLNALLIADRQEGFAFDKAPLMRCRLLRLTDNGYQFIWSHHHLILDGWSASLIVKEVFTMYEALCAGDEPRLASPRPFREYINWLSKRNASQDAAFWQRNLSEFSEPTHINANHQNQVLGGPEVEYEEQEILLSANVTAALQELGQTHRLTLNCLVQGAWALLLSRLNGDSDVVFGSTVSGRPPELPGVEAMVGVFINALPVRVHVPSTGALLPWLQQLMAEQVEREQHAYNSLVDIQSWSGLRPGERLFDSLVIFENYPLRESGSSFEIDDLRLFRRANFPLTLVVVPDEILSLAISFDPSLFDAGFIERILGHLQLLLEQIAANPDRQLRELTLVTDKERALLAQWNSTAAPYAENLSIHEVFADLVRETPDAVALVFDRQSLTYRALDARANQLAHALRERGVGPETLVGVCVERSFDMLIAVLGILKAGGAYLPLDPSYPADRLAFMIEDAAVPVLITQQDLEDRIPTAWAQILLIDAEWPEIASQPEDAPVSGVTPDNLAYVIYTSGSTGTPKGVQLTHRGLTNLAEAQRALFASLSASHVLQFASLSFDASIWEMVMGLCTGATLHLGTAESLLPGPALAHELERGGITHVTLPPTALEILPEAKLPALHTLIVAGEACSPELVERWSQGRRFVNAYGPTEATVCSTAWVCNNEQQSPPIGHPLPNTRTYVFDRDQNPLPIGINGALHVGGVNLARGYLRRAALTAERFVPDPISGIAGARLYNTGDLARYRSDGAIVFLGRSDHQVKIRGHRIELGEIESALTDAHGVKQCVIAAHRDASGNNSLVAYVVSDSGVDPASLRRHLQQRLPEYMIPGLFLSIESLPLLPNGKVDRKALPAPDAAGNAGTRAFRPPRDILEQKLVSIWQEILKVHPIGVEDDFFLLGGHSLLAVRLMAWIEQELGQHLPMATLFKGPTIAQLAAILRQQNEAPTWSSLVAVQSAGTLRPFFFVPGGGGNVFYLYPLAHHLGLDRPFYGLQARGLDGRSTPHASIEEMAADYLEEIVKVQPEGPYLLGGHSSGSWVAFEIARQLESRGQKVAMVAVIDTPAPISATKTSEVDEDEALYLTKIARLIERWANKDLEITYEALKPLNEDEQMAYLEERLKTTDILPPQAGRDQVHGLMQVFKASTRNCTRYLPRASYSGQVALLRAIEIHIEDTGIQINLGSNDKTWGWNQLAAENVDVRILPGDHVTMMAEPHVRDLATAITECILKAEEAHARYE
jgi:amino acid adenylation domain-containing protein